MAMAKTAARRTGSEAGGGIILNQAASAVLHRVFQEMASQSSLDSSRLAQECRRNSSAMLSVCACLKKSIEKARNALQYDLECILNADMAQLDIREQIKNMHDFRSAGRPNGERLCKSLQKMHSCHQQLLEKLETKMDEKVKKLKSARMWSMMDEKEKQLKSTRMWSKISFIIFGAFAAMLLICAVVAAAITAPPAVTGALAVATAFPIAYAGSWIKFLCNRHMHRIQDQYCIFEKMQLHTNNLAKEFMSLCALTLHFEECLEAVASNIRFTDHLDGDAVSLKVAVKEIRKKMKAFVKDLDALQACVTRCETRINSVIFVVVGVENHPHKLEVVVHID